MNAREKLVFAAGSLLSKDFRDDVSRPPRGVEEARALARFGALYQYAFDNVPYYRSKYGKAGLSRSFCATPAEVQRVPCLEKTEFGVNLTARSSWGVALESGGTSGPKASTHLGWDYVVKRYGMLLRVLYGLGWEMGRPISALHPVEYGYWNNLPGMIRRGEAVKAVFEFVQQYVIYRGFHNRRNFYYSGDVFENGSGGDALDQALRRKPFLVISRPDVLGYLVKRGLNDPSRREVAKALVVGNLTVLPAMKRVEDHLGCQALNMYASTEAGYMGLSCPRSGEWVHVDAANYWVETDPAQDNEIIVTDLNNYGMPLIRYRTGDVGELSARVCACGRPGPMLRVLGRKGRCLENERGKKVFDADVMSFFEDFPFLWAYQLCVEPGGKVAARVRAGEALGGRAEKALDEFCGKFGFARGRFRCDYSAPLSRSPSGKLQCIVTVSP
ncbi:MAG TPA: hypothetical protein DEB40_14490 [Elusimicrobia bacterium]|nr:hypothetical protein [Elusimicrobiota bacterium]HBT62942.1 hypothetical protein [Elusimicrobiota bacterium]